MRYYSIVRNIALAVLLLPLSAGCKQKAVPTENNIGFDTFTYTTSYHLFGDEKKPGCMLDIKFTYPNRFGNEPLLKTLQRRFVASALGEELAGYDPQTAVKAYAENYLKSYKELEQDYLKEAEASPEEDPGSWYNYTESISNEVFFNQSHILSYTVLIDSYTGGAHGAHSLMNSVIDLTTGEQIEESDIFIENFKEPIAQLLVDKVVELNQVDNAEKLLDIGYFSIDEIQPNGNILVNEQGITYIFNEYEIAAYAIGATKVLLSFDEISLYLKEENPVAHLYK